MNRWLAHYDPDVPRSITPYPDRTLLDYLRDLACDEPGRPALLFKGASLSYAELERQSGNLDKCRDEFMTGFWSGYSLQGYDRPRKPKEKDKQPVTQTQE